MSNKNQSSKSSNHCIFEPNLTPISKKNGKDFQVLSIMNANEIINSDRDQIQSFKCQQIQPDFSHNESEDICLADEIKSVNKRITELFNKDTKKCNSQKQSRNEKTRVNFNRKVFKQRRLEDTLDIFDVDVFRILQADEVEGREGQSQNQGNQ